MAEPLKNVYDNKYLTNLSSKIKTIYPPFKSQKFVDSIFDKNWITLELKERMRHIAINLNKFLPLEYEEQLKILKEVSKDFFSFEAMFFQDFAQVFGLEDYDNSIKALEIFTIDSSSEFAIREFILKYEDRTINQMKLWCKSENEHLRRLASEGCRPRLPWAIALPKYKKDPTVVLEIIELLKNDKSKYVQKSIANNLNDISKDNPKHVIDFVRKNLHKTKSLDWICKHASRTLLKKGDKEILKLFGYKDINHINIINFQYDKIVNLNDYLTFSFELKSKKSLGKLRVEYIIDYLKSNGTHSKKIFMVSQNDFTQTSKQFIQKQSFKNMTTRKHYLGVHYVSIILNGKMIIKKEFLLNDTSN